MKANSLFVLFVATFASLAVAKPTRIPKEIPAELARSFTDDYDFEGIIALSNCSGSLVRFEKSNGGDKALVMTNGHCLPGGGVAPGEFILGKKASRRITVLDKQGGYKGTLSTDLIVYATETGTDISLYRVTKSYDEIRSEFGIMPLTLSSQHPTEDMPIEVISGYWKKGYTCAVSGFAYLLKESGWTWNDSLRYTQPGCEVIGGTSGSPVVEKGTKTVVAINNTGNEDGEECTLNNPCEVDAQGNVTFQKGHSYGQQTYIIYSCLNEKNEIDLNQRGCMLTH